MRSIFCLMLLAILSACNPSANKKDRPPPLVVVAPVLIHSFVDRYDAVGTASANEQVTLTAPVTERITRLGFNDGDYIEAGHVIAVLAQGQENAALASARAQSRVAEQQLARVAVLRERGFATKSSLDSQIAIAASARAQAAEARASIADRVVRAPFSGFASLRRISVGAVVSAGSEIATISDISSIKLDFSVPETLLGSVSVGQSIEAKAAAFPDAVFHGVVRAVDPVVDPATRSATLRAVLPNPGAKIKPGMLLSVSLQSRPRSAVAVPELALVREGGAQFVFMLQNGKAKRVPVTVGGRDGNLVEVTMGLSPGAQIVTEGVVKLADGVAAKARGPNRSEKSESVSGSGR